MGQAETQLLQVSTISPDPPSGQEPRVTGLTEKHDTASLYCWSNLPFF